MAKPIGSGSTPSLDTDNPDEIYKKAIEESIGQFIVTRLMEDLDKAANQVDGS